MVVPVAVMEGTSIIYFAGINQINSGGDQNRELIVSDSSMVAAM